MNFAEFWVLRARFLLGALRRGVALLRRAFERDDFALALFSLTLFPLALFSESRRGG